MHDTTHTLKTTACEAAKGQSIVYVANTSWYLYNFRLPLMKRMADSGCKVIAVAPRDQYSDRLSTNGITYHPISLSRRGANPFSDLLFLGRLFRLYRRFRPVLIHHFTIKPVIYGSLAARMAGISAVVNAVPGLGYVYSTNDWKARLLRSVVNLLYRIALSHKNSSVIFQNSDDLNVFIKSGVIEPEKAVLIRGSGVDISRFVPAPEPDGKPTVVLCARMLWNKGVGDLVEAACLLKKWNVRADVILVGDTDIGNPAAIPESRLQEWNREGSVIWRGHLDHIHKVFADAHIVVLPSTYGEGVPRSLIEAAACGRPIVATDIPGCREIVRHDINGLLVPPHDTKALAEALKALIENPGMRARMGSKGREIAMSEFSQEYVITSTAKVYDELMFLRS